MYVDVPDPRTTSQNFERKLMGDVARMRGVAGAWAKATWKYSFGSRYSSAIYQLVKGDVDNNWSDGLAEFDSMTSLQKQAWRDAAPYQATFNDPGRVFYALARTIWNWDDARGGHLFEQENPWGGSASSIAAWWTAPLEAYGWTVGDPDGDYYDDRLIQWEYTGAWTAVDDAQALSGTLMKTTEAGASAKINVISKRFRWMYKPLPGGANVEIRLDSGQIGTRDTDYATVYGEWWEDVYREVVPRNFIIKHIGQNGEPFFFDGARPWKFYTWIDRTSSAGAWNTYSTGGPWGSDGYVSAGSGDRAIEFNFVGRWLRLYAKLDNTLGQMRVIIDGESLPGLIDQYRASSGFEYAWIGPFTYGLHRCRLEAAGVGQISFANILVSRKKF